MNCTVTANVYCADPLCPLMLFLSPHLHPGRSDRAPCPIAARAPGRRKPRAHVWRQVSTRSATSLALQPPEPIFLLRVRPHTALASDQSPGRSSNPRSCPRSSVGPLPLRDPAAAPPVDGGQQSNVQYGVGAYRSIVYKFNRACVHRHLILDRSGGSAYAYLIPKSWRSPQHFGLLSRLQLKSATYQSTTLQIVHVRSRTPLQRAEITLQQSSLPVFPFTDIGICYTPAQSSTQSRTLRRHW
ncbi:hypothetical protein DENSPDRAFT_318184 [Dentipellis sp. KUC8613]|nr:hypothetical protein DENSPDRAFT_318184 [Dentipellis sp. KUC8613]